MLGDIRKEHLKLYNEIVSKKLNGIKLLIIQIKVYFLIEKISIKNIGFNKSIEVDDSILHKCYENNKLGIRNLRLLINEALSIYICDEHNEVMRCLNISDCENDNYDSKNIREYLVYAFRKTIFKHEAYYIICDLCLGNLQCGDLIYRISNEVNYLELKKGRINNRIRELIEKKELPDNESASFNKHYRRVLKQIERHSKIDEYLSCPILQGEMIRLPRVKREEAISYVDILNKLYEGINEKQLLELTKKVDNNITLMLCKENILFLANNLEEVINVTDKAINQEMLSYIKYFKEKMRILADSKYEEIYNNIIEDPYIVRPFQLGINPNLYSKLMFNELVLFIFIDVNGIFQLLRDEGYKVYPKKGTANPLYFRMNNKNYIIEKDGKQIYFTLGVFERLITEMLTTEGLVDYINKTLWPFTETAIK
jgi:hypothetical protein